MIRGNVVSFPRSSGLKGPDVMSAVFATGTLCLILVIGCASRNAGLEVIAKSSDWKQIVQAVVDYRDRGYRSGAIMEDISLHKYYDRIYYSDHDQLVPTLGGFSDHHDYRVRLIAIEGLEYLASEYIGSKDALTQISEFLDDDQPVVVSWAENAISRLKDDEDKHKADDGDMPAQKQSGSGHTKP